MTEQLAPPQPPAAKRPCCAVETAAAAAGAASGQSAVDVPVQPVPPQTPPGKRQRQVCQQGVSIAEPAADEDVAAAAEAEVTAATAAAADAPAGSGAEVRRNQCPLPLRYLRGRDTGWQPRDTKPALNVRLDGRIVQSAAGGARISYSHVVVLDDFIDEATRAALLAFLTTPADSEADSGAEAATAATAAADGSERATAEGAPAAHEPAALPGDKWERRTADQAGLAATWGVKVQQRFCSRCLLTGKHYILGTVWIAASTDAQQVLHAGVHASRSPAHLLLCRSMCCGSWPTGSCWRCRRCTRACSGSTLTSTSRTCRPTSSRESRRSTRLTPRQ